MWKTYWIGLIALGAALPASAQWQLIDDFQQWEAGDIYANATEIGWHASCLGGSDEYWFLADPYNQSNVALYIETPQYGEYTNAFVMKELPDGGIAPGESGTIFFKALWTGNTGGWHIGTSDKDIEYDAVTGQQITPGAWADFNAQVRLNSESNTFEHRDGDLFVPTSPPISPETNQWYKFVLQIENAWDATTVPPTSTGVFTLYMTGPGIGDGSSWSLVPVASAPMKDSAFFRRSPIDKSGDPSAITWLIFATNQGNPASLSGDPFLLDDFYFSHGKQAPPIDGDPPYPWSSCWQLDPETGDVDTGSLVGWINVIRHPYLWSYALDGWIYMQEPACDAPGAWAYFYK